MGQTNPIQTLEVKRLYKNPHNPTKTNTGGWEETCDRGLNINTSSSHSLNVLNEQLLGECAVIL
jgi:hypothetical protein